MLMPGRSHRGPLSPLTADQTATRVRLGEHVRTLAGEIGERHRFELASLRSAEWYVRGRLERLGHEVAAQAVPCFSTDVNNLEVVLEGAEPAAGTVVVGAHYDSVSGSPGANDNASGVAVLLELVRVLSPVTLRRRVRAVAFVNEEPPFFRTPMMGSLHHAHRCRDEGEAVSAMLALESVGHYSRRPKSQRYPFPFSLVYPSTGSFVAFVGNLRSLPLVRRAVAAFRAAARFPSEGAAVPRAVPGAGWSDHWSYWKAGYRALMVTDTSFYRDTRYHTARDTPEHVDLDAMARVTHGLAAVIRDLAGAPPA
jgi:Zn-dependent M28 family amino/carboxypeptidase